MRVVAALMFVVAACGRFGFDPAGGGGDGDGGIDAPLPVGRWVRAALSSKHGCGITVDGELWCWGKSASVADDGRFAAPRKIGDASTWTDAAASDGHSCGLRTDGSLWCWGHNGNYALGEGLLNQQYDDALPVAVGTAWKQVGTGVEMSCAIRDDDTLWCWGWNTYGQLGTGDTVTQARPAQIAAGTSWKDLAVGERSVCAIRSDDTLWCWGRTNEGQLGVGLVTSGATPTPQQVSTPAAWRSVAAGAEHFCAIDGGGDTYCWGRNYEAQLGDGSRSRRSTPVRVDVVAAELAAGASHTCARTIDGALRCWGDGTRGRLSEIDAVDRPVPASITAPAVSALALGGATTCVIDDARRLWCTGANDVGQAGVAGGEVYVFERADLRTDWTGIDADASHACGVTSDGEVHCWGRGAFGQIGDGAQLDRQRPSATGVIAQRVVVSAVATFGVLGTNVAVWGYDQETDVYRPSPRTTPAAIIAASHGHTCRLAGTNLSRLGDNGSGQLGIGSIVDQASYVTVAGAWTDLAVHDATTCAIADGGGGLSCWGWGPHTGTNNAGDVMTPTSVAAIPGAVAQVTLGDGYGCARETSGALWCWGRNLFGQLGDGTTTDRATAVRAGTRTDWIDVDAGDLHTCGVTADGALWCWGHMDEGQHGDGSAVNRATPTRIGTASDWADVACGAHFTCALKTDGTRWCSGVNRNGQLGNGRAWLPAFTVVP